jgi:hypothetical protein
VRKLRAITIKFSLIVSFPGTEVSPMGVGSYNWEEKCRHGVISPIVTCNG